MRCKNCGWDNPDENAKCEKCNAALSEWTNESAATKMQSIEVPFNPRQTAMGCPKCGYPVRPSDEQCPNCDAPIVASIIKSETKVSAPKPISKGTVIGGITPDEQPTTGKKLAGFLVTYSHSPLGDFYPLFEGRNFIGRDTSSDISIPNDEQISSKHISILYRSVDKKFKFKDEQSINGSFINEELLDEGELKNLDVIRIGFTKLLLMVIPQF